MYKNKVLQFLFTLIIFKSYCLGEECDKTECPGNQKLYQELECTPIYQNGQCCPVSYNCPDLSKRDPNKCYLHGKEYNVSDYVPFEETGKYCVPGCHCNKYGVHANFVCTHFDCPEFFGPRDPECVRTYEIDSCCANGKVCDKDREKLAKCYVEGKEYHEGQKIYPDLVSCQKCICKPGFDNSTIVGNPNCKQVECGLLLHYGEKLMIGCASIYYGDNKCCPIGHRCPNPEKDEVIPTKRNEDGEQCTFGKLKLFIGDELKSDEAKVTCHCVTPPYIQCIQERNLD